MWLTSFVIISSGLHSDYDLGRIFQILMNVKFLGAVLKFVSIEKEGSNVTVSMVIRRTHTILLDAGKNGIHYLWYAVYEKFILHHTTSLLECYKNKKDE